MTPKNPTKPLIPYIRQSRAKERTISIEEQRRIIGTWAQQNRVALGPEVVEQNVSGNKPWQERGLGQVIADCGGRVSYETKDGEIVTLKKQQRAQGVVVAFQDRLTRENGLGTAEVWAALEEAGARLVSAGEGLDTAKGDEELNFGMRALIARVEWKRHRKNWESARQNAIERGVTIGPTPVGYTRSVIGRNPNGRPIHGKLIPNEHAPHIREAFQMRASGHSLSEIGDFLRKHVEADNHRGKLKNGTVWSVPGVETMLSSRVYLGEIRSGAFVNQTAHDPIVSRALWLAVQRKKGKDRKRSRGARPPALLAGILRCGSCGGALSRDVAKDRTGTPYEMYRCKKAHCEHRVTISLPRVDELLLGLATQLFLFRVRDTRPDRGVEVLRLEREIAHAEADIEAHAQSFLAEGLSPANAAKMMAQLEARKASLEAELDALAVGEVDSEIPPEIASQARFEDGVISITGDVLREVIDGMDGAWRNRWIRSIFDSVTIAPSATRFTRDRKSPLAPTAARIAAFKLKGQDEVIPGETVFEEGFRPTDREIEALATLGALA